MLVMVCEIPDVVPAKLLPRSRLFIKLPPEYAPLVTIPKIRTTMMAMLLHPSCVMTNRKVAHPILPVATNGRKLNYQFCIFTVIYNYTTFKKNKGKTIILT
jgi:hypothetical protein